MQDGEPGSSERIALHFDGAVCFTLYFYSSRNRNFQACQSAGHLPIFAGIARL